MKTLAPSADSKTESPNRGDTSHANVYSNPEQPPAFTPMRRPASPRFRVASMRRIWLAAFSEISTIWRDPDKYDRYGPILARDRRKCELNGGSPARANAFPANPRF